MAYSDIDRRINIWFYNCLMNLNWNFSCDPIVVSELKNSKIEYIIPDFTYFHDAVDHTSVWTLNPENTSDRSWKLLYVRSEHSKILRITFFAEYSVFLYFLLSLSRGTIIFQWDPASQGNFFLGKSQTWFSCTHGRCTNWTYTTIIMKVQSTYNTLNVGGTVE